MLTSCDQVRGEGGCSGSEDRQGCGQVRSCLSPRSPNPSAVLALAPRSVFPGSQTRREESGWTLGGAISCHSD